MSKTVKPVPLQRTLRSVAIEIAELWPRVMEEGEPHFFGLGGCVANEQWKWMRTWGIQRLDDRMAGHVQDFLSNASAWHGPDAQRIKAELRGALAHFEHEAGRQWNEVTS